MFRETPNTAAKAKRKLLRVNREYSGLGIIFILILLMTQFAFTPQTGGMPRAVAGAYAPTSLSAAAIPIIPTEPMPQWMDMLNHVKTTLKASDVVVAWWDYGYWLSVMGNVTTLADNATVNSTQIENLAFVYMADESLALKMLTAYGQQNVKYILVFTVLVVQQDTSSGVYYSKPWGYGDEGKWSWMADISGGAKDRLIKEGFMNPNNAWTDRSAFGSYTDNGDWSWNAQGANSVIHKLLSDMEDEFSASTNGLIMPVYGSSTGSLDYFNLVYLAGVNDYNLSAGGTIVPLIGLYEINWAAYNAGRP